MNTYVVLGASRIQQWITRTPRLALARGASKALTVRTGPDHLRGRFPTHLKISEEVPHIAGVVVLESDVEVSDEDVHACLALISDELPGVEWKAWVAPADTYVDAYLATNGGTRCDRFFHRAPSIRRSPMLAECDGCHEESAVRTHTWNDGKIQRYGPDCLVRLHHSKDADKGEAIPEAPRDASQFEDLINVEPKWTDKDNPDPRQRVLGRRDANNHLALIAADGNRIGDFFKAVSDLGDPETHRELSNALDKATKHAVAQAREQASARMYKPCFQPDIVHYVGGDDVLVTVAGRFAWIWATALVEAFEETFRDRIEEILNQVRTRSLRGAGATNEKGLITAIEDAADQASLAVGMVFAHSKSPFAGTRELVQQVEANAKRGGRGERSTIAWADVTVDHAAKSDFWIDAEIARHEVETGHLFQCLDSSARSMLDGLLREGDPAVRFEEIKKWARRTDQKELESFLIEQAKAVGEQHAWQQTSVHLDRMRWWPVAQEVEK